MMYLIDTHVLIWYLLGNQALSPATIKVVQNPANQIFISKASLWEMAIKVSLGKLSIGVSFEELERFLTDQKFFLLDFTYQDLQALSKLPFLHRDPFDRLLICQAINGGMRVITDDNKFSLYPVQLLENE